MAELGEKKKSGIPGLITTMLATIPILIIIGYLVINNEHGNKTLGSDTASSWVSAIATVVISLLTIILAKETWSLRLAQLQQLEELKRENIRPNIGIQIEGSPVGMNFFNVKVSNYGKGIARKLTFEFFDRNGTPVEPQKDVLIDKFRKLAMFRVGIESMGIGQVITSYVFSFIELNTELAGDVFKPYLNIVVKFEDVEGNRYTNELTIDFAQYEGITELGDGDPIHNIAKEIKQIREHIQQVVGNSKERVGVDIYSAQDREEETLKRNIWLEKQKLKHQNLQTPPDSNTLPQ